MIDLFTLEELGRALYNHLRNGIVAAGNLPDISLMANEAAYTAAKAAIVTSGKTVIEIFGEGSSLDRGEKTSTRVTINRLNNRIGFLGGDTEYYQQYTKADGTIRFRRIKVPSNARSIDYEVRVYTDKTSHSRTVQNIINSVFGTRKYLNTFLNLTTQSEKGFLLYQTGEVDMSTPQWIETIYRYSIDDVFLGIADDVVLDNIPALTSVEFSPNLYGEEDAPLIKLQLKDFNPDGSENFEVYFESGLIWKLDYSTIFRGIFDITVLSATSPLGIDLLALGGTTVVNNTMTKIITITFATAQKGTLIIGKA